MNINLKIWFILDKMEIRKDKGTDVPSKGRIIGDVAH